MTVIGFVRHGVTAWNEEGRVQGSSDIPLNEKGVRSAEMLAARLADERWDLIYTSPMKRAKHTAAIIAEAAGIEVIEEPRVRERSSGLIEGTTEEERLQRWGPDWRSLEMQFETAESVITRGLDFVNEQRRIHPDKKVLVVSHGSFIKRVIAQIMEDQKYAVKIDNSSLTVIDTEQKCCLLLNDTAHLAGGTNGNSI